MSTLLTLENQLEFPQLACGYHRIPIRYVLCRLDEVLQSTFEKSYMFNKLFLLINKSEPLQSIHFIDISLYCTSVLLACYQHVYDEEMSLLQFDFHSLTYSFELKSFIEIKMLKCIARSEFFETHTNLHFF